MFGESKHVPRINHEATASFLFSIALCDEKLTSLRKTECQEISPERTSLSNETAVIANLHGLTMTCYIGVVA